jgi:aspartate 1-decarboxylase
MLIRVCTSKIHRAIVTEAKLDYIGSVTIDQDLMEASGLKPYQMVNINNVNNGTFWQTYVIAGKRGQGTICLNGPPARHFQPGDPVIIIGEAYIDPAELRDLNPLVVFVDDKNKITKVEKHNALEVIE